MYAWSYKSTSLFQPPSMAYMGLLMLEAPILPLPTLDNQVNKIS